MILNKEARADSGFVGLCEDVVEAFGNCVAGTLLPSMYSWVCELRVFRYGQVRSRTCH